MTTIQEAQSNISQQQSQIQEQRVLAEQRRQEASRVESQLKTQLSKIPQVTQQRLRNQTYSGLAGMQRLRQIKKAEGQIKGNLSEVEQYQKEISAYEQELAKYETETLQPYSQSVAQAQKIESAYDVLKSEIERAVEKSVRGFELRSSARSISRIREAFSSVGLNPDEGGDLYEEALTSGGTQSLWSSSGEYLGSEFQKNVTPAPSFTYTGKDLSGYTFEKKTPTLNVRDLTSSLVQQDIKPFQQSYTTGIGMVSATPINLSMTGASVKDGTTDVLSGVSNRTDRGIFSRIRTGITNLIGGSDYLEKGRQEAKETYQAGSGTFVSIAQGIPQVSASTLIMRVPTPTEQAKIQQAQYEGSFSNLPIIKQTPQFVRSILNIKTTKTVPITDDTSERLYEIQESTLGKDIKQSYEESIELLEKAGRGVKKGVGTTFTTFGFPLQETTTTIKDITIPLYQKSTLIGSPTTGYQPQQLIIPKGTTTTSTTPAGVLTELPGEALLILAYSNPITGGILLGGQFVTGAEQTLNLESELKEVKKQQWEVYKDSNIKLQEGERKLTKEEFLSNPEIESDLRGQIKKQGIFNLILPAVVVGTAGIIKLGKYAYGSSAMTGSSIEEGSINFIKPANIKKTPLSKTFANEEVSTPIIRQNKQITWDWDLDTKWKLGIQQVRLKSGADIFVYDKNLGGFKVVEAKPRFKENKPIKPVEVSLDLETIAPKSIKPVFEYPTPSQQIREQFVSESAKKLNKPIEGSLDLKTIEPRKITPVFLEDIVPSKLIRREYIMKSAKEPIKPVEVSLDLETIYPKKITPVSRYPIPSEEARTGYIRKWAKEPTTEGITIKFTTHAKDDIKREIKRFKEEPKKYDIISPETKGTQQQLLMKPEQEILKPIIKKFVILSPEQIEKLKGVSLKPRLLQYSSSKEVTPKIPLQKVVLIEKTTKTELAPKIISIQPQQIKLEVKPQQENRQQLIKIQKQFIEPSAKQIFLQKQEAQLLQSPKQSLVQKQVSKQMFVESTSQSSRQKSKQVQKQEITTKTKIPTRLIPLIKSFMKKEKEKNLYDEDFETLGKRFGKYSSLGKFETLEKAREKGIGFAKGTLGASFKITRKGETIPLSKLGLSQEFRPSKREIDTAVQRREFRLSTGGERREIKSARKRKKVKWL